MLLQKLNQLSFLGSVQGTGETVWLSQQQMADLYQTTRPNIVQHIRNIYADGELEEQATCKKFLRVRQEGNRQVTREMPFYNLDMIISLGYRIRSVIATHFRRWATERLKEYVIKGFTMDDERLKGNSGGAYWRELLDRIRDIRSSEKVLYRQVLDLYATAVDYDPRSDISVEFFKIVQNKLHFAAHGNTAGTATTCMSASTENSRPWPTPTAPHCSPSSAPINTSP